MPNMKGEAPQATLGPAQDMQQGKVDENDPKVQQIRERAKKYETVLINIIHGKKTRDQVLEVLKSNPDPFITIPQAAMTVNDMGVMTMKQGGVDVTPDIQMVASQLVLNDLAMLGEGVEAFQLEEGDMEAILEDTYQAYVHRGLIDKSIDPIMLQLEVQDIMDPEQQAAGMVLGQGKVPGTPDRRAVLEQQGMMREHQAVKKVGAKQAKKQAVEKRDKLTALASQKMQGGE